MADPLASDPFYSGLPAERPAPAPAPASPADAPADVPADVRVEMLPVPAWPPAFADLVCEFVVVGEPKTAGSKKAFVNPKTGRAIVTDDVGVPGKVWRELVSSAGLRYRRVDEPLDCRLAMEMVFVYPHAPADYSKRDQQLRGAVRVAPHVRPDVLKLGRAVEDALTSILYADDARITEELLRKVHVPKDRGPMRAEVRLYRLPTTVAELRELRAPAERYEGEEEPAQGALI